MARLQSFFGTTRDRVMFMSNRIVALTGLCAWLISWAVVASANAAEQIIVPFTCEIGGGDIYARPSQPQSYSIIGEREAAPFTACASDGSERCRTMMLHRFDIDCDGQRVGWPEFYTAISDATSGRAFVEGDRLLVRVRPQRTRRAARSRFEPPRSRRSFVVEMPDGFAPLRGTVARFKGGRSARNAPLRATRDPFSTPPPQPPITSNESVARVQPKPAAVKPEKQPTKKTARHTIIEVPQDQPTSNAARNTKPTILTPGVAAAPKPQTKEQLKSKEKSPPAKTPKKLKVVKAPPVQTNAQPLNETETSGETESNVKSESKATAETTAIIPKLLNGPKDTNPNKATAAAEKKPDSIADLLQTRGAKLRADADTPAFPRATQKKSESAASLEPVASPTLANTLAVLGIVAGLMLVFAYAAYHFLTPNTAPPLTLQRAARAAKKQAAQGAPQGTHTLRVKGQEPSLTGMAQPAVKRNEEDKSQTNRRADPSRLNTPHTDPTPDKASPPAPQIEIPKQPEPTRQASAKSSTDFVAPQLSAPSGLNASEPLKKTEPTLPLESAHVPNVSDKREPELPMPSLVADQIKQPDFDESALLLPKTRQEALTALGVAESAGEDVIERVVAGLRQCWRPDESNDKAERKRRLQRMEQIETAWRILSEPQNATREDAENHPN